MEDETREALEVARIANFTAAELESAINGLRLRALESLNRYLARNRSWPDELPAEDG